MQSTRPLCLASASPRRRELLARFGLPFAVMSPQLDERVVPGEAAQAHINRLAALKAEAALRHYPRHLILSGDTVVVHDGKILGKPADGADAERMLAALSGNSHRVLSAYLLLDGPTGQRCGRTVESRVFFRQLPPAWIRWYSRLDESRDKAGAYAIQGLGAAMVHRIEGSYTNVVGFPIDAILWDLMDKGWVSL